MSYLHNTVRNMAGGAERCIKCNSMSTTPVTVRCGRPLCDSCLDSTMQESTCSVCKRECKVKTGDMPQGVMAMRVLGESLPGNEGHGTICIDYHFYGGIQSPYADHPYRGARYEGKDLSAYLPDSPEGQQILALLKIAWQRRLTFRLATSCWLMYRGVTNTTLCYNIGHKRRRDGGVMNNGYPDPNYLQRCKDELAALGVTEGDITPAVTVSTK